MPETGLDEWMPKSINSPKGHEWAKANNLDEAWLAVRHCLRNSLVTARLVDTSSPVATTQGLGYVWPIAFAVVGVAAAGAGYFWGTDKNEKEAEVKSLAIYGHVAEYLANIDARLLAGQPVPPPPANIQAIAAEERNYPYWLLGAGAALGGAAALGIVYALRPRYSYARSAQVTPPSRRLPAAKRNPSRPRRRATTRRARARAVPPGIKAPRRARRARRASNPLKSGYSKSTVNANIAQLLREGRPRSQASAAALRSARAAWKVKHGRKALPAHLKPKKKNPTSRTTTTTTRRTTTTAAPRKRRAAKRPTKASFLAGQMAKGRSKKQAQADWNAKRRLAKLRRGK
jgi:hypothetical protein